MGVNDWFPHDYNAGRDIKILRLLHRGGAAYYGMYWLCVEYMHSNAGAMQVHADAMQVVASVDEMQELLQLLLHIQPEDSAKFISDCIWAGLFERLDVADAVELVTCERVTRNMQRRQAVTERKRQAAVKRWDAAAMQQHAGAMHSDAGAMQNDAIRLDKIRVDKNRESKEARTSLRDARPDGLSTVAEYFSSLGMPSSEAQRFLDYYTANGWKVGRNPMKDWKAAARNWKKGYQDKLTAQQPMQARTAPQGLPKQVTEIANRPPLSSESVEAAKALFLSKVTGGE